MVLGFGFNFWAFGFRDIGFRGLRLEDLLGAQGLGGGWREACAV